MVKSTKRYRFIMVAALACVMTGSLIGYIEGRHRGDGAAASGGQTVSTDGPATSSLATLRPADPALVFPAELSSLPNFPSKLVVDESGTVWFVLFREDGGNPRLYSYVPESGVVQTYDLLGGRGGKPLFWGMVSLPNWIAIGYNGTFVLFDRKAQKVKEISLDTATNVRPSLSAFQAGMGITDVIASPDGLVFVSRVGVNAVTEINPSTGNQTQIVFPASFPDVMQLASAQGKLWLSTRLGQPDGTLPELATLDPQTGEFRITGTANVTGLISDGTSVYAVSGRNLLRGDQPGGEPAAAATVTTTSGSFDMVVADSLNGAVWTSSMGASQIGLTRADGSSQVFQLPTYLAFDAPCPPPPDYPKSTPVCAGGLEEGSDIQGIALAPNGDLYFSDGTKYRIGLIPASAANP